jgi:hypothetical protein
MADIFVSFIHEEEDAASELERFVRDVFDNRVDSFMSSEGWIHAGDEWMRRVFDELDHAKVLISMLSPASVGRPWINFEAGAGWFGRKKVIPALFCGLSISDLKQPLSSLQAVELENYAGISYLVSSIAFHLKIDPPNKPAFASTEVSLGNLNQNENERVLAPYKRLRNSLKELRP